MRNRITHALAKTSVTNFAPEIVCFGHILKTVSITKLSTHDKHTAVQCPM